MLDRRLQRLEVIYQAPPATEEVPPGWQVYNANDRVVSRARRATRAWLEEVIMERTEGNPPPFDQELEDILGLQELMPRLVGPWGKGMDRPHGLWEPNGIKYEDCFLRNELGSEEQERIDNDIMRRWDLAHGVSISEDEIDQELIRLSEIINESLERLRKKLERERMPGGGG